MPAPTSLDGCRRAKRGFSRVIPAGQLQRLLDLDAEPADRAWWATVYVAADPARPLTDADDGARVVLSASWELDGARVAYEVDLARGCSIRFPAGRGQIDARVVGPADWYVRATSAIGTTPQVARPFVAVEGVDTVRVDVAPTCYEAIALSHTTGQAFGTAQVDLRAASPIDATLGAVLTAAGFPPPPLPCLPNQVAWEATSRTPDTGITIVQYLGA